MRTGTLIVGLALAAAGAAQADPITYEVHRVFDQGDLGHASIDGSITTDGTIGSLQDSRHIVALSLDMTSTTGPRGTLFAHYDLPFNWTTGIDLRGVSSTATDLIFDAFSDFSSFQLGSWSMRGGLCTSPEMFVYVCREVYLSVPSLNIEHRERQYVFATVPEPTSAALLLAGLALLASASSRHFLASPRTARAYPDDFASSRTRCAR